MLAQVKEAENKWDLANGQDNEPLSYKIGAKYDELRPVEWGAKAVEGEGGIGDDEDNCSD